MLPKSQKKNYFFSMQMELERVLEYDEDSYYCYTASSSLDAIIGEELERVLDDDEDSKKVMTAINAIRHLCSTYIQKVFFMKNIKFNKIVFVKTGWSDLYEGGYVLGNHRYLKQTANIGHEIYNFKKTKIGYCAYIPPSAGSCPQLFGSDSKDWLVIFLARENGNGPLCVIGYYENAKIYNELQDRPEYEYEKFETDNNGDKFRYCIKSKEALRLPLEKRREWEIPKNLCKHIGSTPIIYVRGPKSKNEIWRKDFADIAERLLKDENSHGHSFPKVDPKTRRKIEIVAVKKNTQVL